MERSQHCSKCNYTRVGLLDYLPDTSGLSSEPSYEALGTIRYHPVSISEKSENSYAGRVIISGENLLTKAGTIEATVCPRCGHIERYVQDPQWMPFERLMGFSWVNGPPSEDEKNEVTP